MKALITGASSGIGKEMAYILNKRGYELILVARRYEKLEELKKIFGEKTIIIKADLSKREEVFFLFDNVRNEDIEIVINNAGFGKLGEFLDVSLDEEIDMIETNAVTPHILTKLFLREFIKKDRGYILNVASIASFFASPYFATYYATKAYIKTLTEGISAELKRKKSNVYIGALCPGPVKTEFDSVANAHSSLKGADPKKIAEYAIKKLFRKKTVILPTLSVKLAVFFSHFIPRKLLIYLTDKSQLKKLKKTFTN